MTQEKFINKAKTVYGDKYDYSKVIYKGWDDKVIVIDNYTKKEKAVKPRNFLYNKYNCATKEEKANAFIKKSKERFGDKFDYSKVKYTDSQTPVTLICKEHGEFNVDMYRHLYSEDGLCPLCHGNTVNGCDRGGRKQLSTEHIIKKCQHFYGDKYDYSKVIYKGGRTKEEVVEIICPAHGSFFKCVDNINKRDCGCPRCAREKKKSNDIIFNANKFIERSKEKFGDRFDYSEVKYVNSQTPIILICKGHGVRFNIIPNVHLNSKFGGCKECYKDYIESTRSKNIRVKLTEEERKERRKKHFIETATKKFGNRFDYSMVEYINCNTPVNIIDKESNNKVFSIKPYKFLNTFNGIPDEIEKRKKERRERRRKEFIERARKIHGDKYDYSAVEYITYHTKVCIICPKHGKFWQTPSTHLKIDRNGCGCPKCAKAVSKLEEDVINRLTKENIKFRKEYINKDIFGKMRGDFFIKSYNVMIECQGKQHFMELNSFHESYGGSLLGQQV